MKAVLLKEFGGPSVLKVAEVALPKCGAEDVVIKVAGAAVNSIDLGLIGDRVFCSQTKTGAYAQYVLVGQNNCWNLPESIDLADGSAIGTSNFIAYRALFHRANTKPGDTVLIHGASGAVGSAAVQICNALGIRVFGTAGNDQGLEFVKSLGVAGVFNHNDEKHVEKIKEAVGNEGVEVILEMADTNLPSDLQLLAPGGTVVVIGSRGGTHVNPLPTMMKECNVLMGSVLPRAKSVKLE